MKHSNNGIVHLTMYLTYTRLSRHVELKFNTNLSGFSATISSAIKQRKNFHGQAIQYNTESHWREYRLARNEVVHLIRKAKRDFCRKSIDWNIDNPKNLWKIIRNLTRSQCSNLPSHLLVDGIIYASHSDIAKLFNAYFVLLPQLCLTKTKIRIPTGIIWKKSVRSKLPPGASFLVLTLHFITFLLKMTRSLIPSLASESLAHASLLLLILLIAFSTIWTTKS